MLIGFDIRPIIFTRAGIRTYLYNLIVHLARRNDCRLCLFVSSPSHIQWQSLSKNLTETVIRFPHLNTFCERFWQEVLLPQAVRRQKIEVFHGGRFFLPRKLSCFSAVTIHDLAFKLLPSLVSRKTAAYFDSLISSAALAARKIIVPSQTTKDDLMRLYKIAAEKIAVIYEAADPGLRLRRDSQKLQSVRDKFKIKDRFILSVGTLEPRKNIARLLQAYQLCKPCRQVSLVIAGGSGWLYEETMKQLKELFLQKRVIFTGHISAEELACLYQSCEAFIFPSLYEGFGLPVLEAMQCKAAVVASNNSSLAELFGAAFEPVDPYQIDSISNGISRVLLDSGLRQHLQKKGLEKARQFSWEITAEKTMAVYREIAEGK